MMRISYRKRPAPRRQGQSFGKGAGLLLLGLLVAGLFLAPGLSADCPELRPASVSLKDTAHYDNGRLKFAGGSVDGWMHGPALSWYENGRLRSSMLFDRGAPSGTWVRFGEKIPIVAQVSFCRGKLDGPIRVHYSRGYGQGTGHTFILSARFSQGRLIGSFNLKYSDTKGATVAAEGEVGPDGRISFNHLENIEEKGDSIRVGPPGRKQAFAGFEAFLTTEINRRIWPMFTLDFCGVSLGDAPDGPPIPALGSTTPKQ